MPKEWTPHDDMLLRDAVQNTNDFAKINRNVRFSFGRPNARELEDRWRKLLYDPEVSECVISHKLLHLNSFRVVF